MNKTNLKAVRDAMAAAPKHKVDMSDICSNGRHYPGLLDNECGSCGCICGYTLALFDPTFEGDSFGRAAEILEIDDYDAIGLFLGDWTTTPLEDITKQEVIEHLDKLLEN